MDDFIKSIPPGVFAFFALCTPMAGFSLWDKYRENFYDVSVDLF